MPVQDAAERERALSPNGCFIVQAPAGSGKTELLIQRCLVLLARVERPESVVAITFTIKAAAEMRRRLLDALRAADEPEPAAEHQRRTWELARAVRERDAALRWDILGNPHRLEIRTIDSLCAAIVRRMPWVSRLGAPPDILEDARELYAEAARQTVALVEHEACTDALGRLLLHLDNNVAVLQDLIAGMLARRDQWLRHIGTGVDREEARAALEHAIENAVLEAMEAVSDCAPACVVDAVPDLAAFAASNLDPSSSSHILACQDMGELPPATLEALPQWLGIAELLLTKNDGGKARKRVDRRTGFPPGSNSRKEDIEAVLEALQNEPEFCAALHALRSLPPVTYTDDQWTVMDALLTVLPIAVGQLGVVFQIRGQIDFGQIMLSALAALGPEDQPTNLALAFDYRIEHLLVDEFQDTSVTQWQLLERLTAGWTRGDGRTLFVVGDPMQSIYRFREAEVGLFIRASQTGIGGVRLQPLRLSVNFRSESGIVDWINEAFPGIFPATSDAAAGAVSYSTSVAHRPAGPGRAVQVHPFIGDSDDEEATQVVDIVRGCTGKTAILVRARTHLPSILWALREARIPYRAVEIDCLRDLPVIQDLLALTCALLHPADRVAWLAVLRAPWCGLTLADLHTLTSDLPRAIVYELLKDDTRLDRLSPAAAASVRRVRSALEASLAQPGRALRDVVEGAWTAIGGPACVRGAGDLENAGTFFDLLESLDRGGDADLDALRTKVSLLFAAPDPAADDSLQVMSIHKAKGLEFDTVIVPGLGRKTRTTEARLLLWEERPGIEGGPGELLLAPIKAAGTDFDSLYDFVRDFDARKSRHEIARLLYVACTRAKRTLHLLGSTGADKNGLARAPEPSSFLARLWSTVQPEWNGLTAPQTQERSDAPPRQILRRLPHDWQMGAVPPGVELPPGPASEDSRPLEPTFDWVRNTLRRTGVVVHAMLGEIAREGSPAWDTERVRALRPRAEAALASLGVSPNEIPGAADTVEQALIRTLEDKRGRQILGTHWSEAGNEVSLTGVLDRKLITIRVDRTYVDHTGTRWIVDFKTSSHEGGSPEDFLDRECERYAEEMRRYRELWSLHENRPVKTALYFPLLGAWREVG